MNIEKKFLLVCENAILDDKNRLSLIGTFNAVNAFKVPVMHQRLFVIANLDIREVKKPSNIELSIEMFSPSGRKVIANPPVINRPLEVKEDVQNVGGIFEIRNIVFPEFGNYKVALIVNRKELGDFSLELRKEIRPDVS